MVPLLVCELAFIGYAVGYAHAHGHWEYLPPPLFYDPVDHFMDFFNTNYWAFRQGRYSEWRSTYPLFVFFLGRLIGSEQCAAGTPFAMRMCDFSSLWLLAAAYTIGMAACARRVVRSIAATRKGGASAVALLAFFAFALSLPGMFALERGNYIIVAFVCVALAAALEWKLASAVLLAVAINIKPYLVLLWLPFLFGKRFGFVGWSMLFVVVLDGLARVFVDESSYSLLLENMRGFASSTEVSFFEKLWYPTTLNAWARAIEGSSNSLLPVPGAEWYPVMRWVGIFVRLGVLAVAACLTVAALLRIRQTGATYACFCGILALLASSDATGGYGLLFLLPFISAPLERNDLRWLPWFMFAILVPLDYAIGPFISITRHDPNTQETLHRTIGLGIGSYLRPVFVFGLLLYLLRDYYRKWKFESTANSAPAPSASKGTEAMRRLDASAA